MSFPLFPVNASFIATFSKVGLVQGRGSTTGVVLEAVVWLGVFMFDPFVAKFGRYPWFHKNRGYL